MRLPLVCTLALSVAAVASVATSAAAEPVAPVGEERAPRVDAVFAVPSAVLGRAKADPYGRPRKLPYDEGEPIPTGYHVEEKPQLGFIIAGSTAVFVPWVASLMVAGFDYVLDRDHPIWQLAIPVVGPFLTIGSTPYTAVKAILVFDGVMQSAGVVMLAYGLATTRKILVLDGLGVKAVPTPTIGPHHLGLGLTGAF